MNVVEKLLRLGTVGLGLTWLTSCYGVSGSFGDDTVGGPSNNPTKSSGNRRQVDVSGNGWAVCLDAAGNPTACFGGAHVKSLSTLTGVKWDGGAASVGTVTTYNYITARNGGFAGTGPCQGFDSAFCGVYNAANPSGNLTHVGYTVSDTSGGGGVSAGDFVCNITSHIAFGGVDLFTDTTNCVSSANPPGGLSTGVQSGTAGGTWLLTANDPNNNNNGRIGQLPLDLRIDLMNSIDTSKDVKVVTAPNGQRQETVRFYLTNVRYGGASYKPTNAYFDVIDFERHLMGKTPGLQLTAAWLANQMEANLGRGTARGSITINDSVTISSDQLAQLMGANVKTKVVGVEDRIAALRTYAMRSGRSE
jgi:hypothetical protein